MAITQSIKLLYTSLEHNTLHAYSAHLKISRNIHGRKDDIPDVWMKINRAYTCEKARKRSILENKLKALTTTQVGQDAIGKPKEQFIPNYVINRSNEHFTPEQLSLLKKGLNFAIRDPTFPKEDIVIDFEAGIKYASHEEKDGAREESRRLLTSTKRMARKKRASSNH